MVLPFSFLSTNLKRFVLIIFFLGFTATTATAQTPNVVGWVWADQQSATENYIPSGAYQYNSNDSVNTVTRTSVGTYRVYFTDFAYPASPPNLGTPKVTAYASNNHCIPTTWFQSSNDLVLAVSCTDPSGNPADTRFTALYYREVKTGNFWNNAYVYANQPTADSYTAQENANWNPTGTLNRIERAGIGQYTVILPGIAKITGNPQVTAFVQTDSYCKVTGWGGDADSEGTRITVNCFDMDGNLNDTYYVLSYISNLTLGKNVQDTTSHGGYVWTSSSISDIEYTPAANYNFNTTNINNTSVRTGTGVYTVTFPDLKASSSSTVMVSAMGSDANYCNVTNWGAGTNVTVSCYDASGTPANSLFNILYLTDEDQDLPQIETVSHAPNIPSPDEDVIISSTLTDADGVISSAGVQWTLNDVLQAVIPFSNIGGNDWTATLPAQAGGSEISYRVIAIDNNENRTFSTENDSAWTVKPSTTTDLFVNAIAETQITLSWPAVEGADTYTIFRGDTDPATTPIVTDFAATQFTDTGLPENTTYYYRIQAVNEGGSGNYSNSVSGTTGEPVPGTPEIDNVYHNPGAPYPDDKTFIFATIVDDNLIADSLQIVWQVNGVNQAKRKMVLQDADQSLYRGTIPPQADFAVIDYRITVEDDLGLFTSSEIITFRVDGPPAVPFNLSIVAAGFNQLDFSWESGAEPDLAKYYFYQNGILHDSVDADQNSWSDNSVVPSVYYTYNIVAADTAGNTSDAGNFTEGSIPPPAPYSEVITAAPVFVYFEWEYDDFDALNGFRIIRSSASQPAAEIDYIQDNSFNDDDVQEDTLYTYTVIAVDSLFIESSPLTFQVTAQDNQAPADPQNFVGITGSSSIKIKWTPNAENDLQGYYLTRDDWSDPDTIFVQPDDSFYVDTDVSAGVTYNYSFASFDNFDNISDWVDISATPFTYEANFSYAITDAAFPDPSDEQDYRMISLPGDDDLSLADAMSGDFDNHWKAYYENGKSSEDQSIYLTAYSANDPVFSFAAGRGFWIISNAGWETENFLTAAENVELSDESTYEIDLVNGWNIISNPFNKNVTWANVLIENPSVSQNIWAWNGSSYSSASQLQPYAGYYFFNVDNLNRLTIPHPDKITVSAAKQDQSNEVLATENVINPPAIFTVSFDDEEASIQLRLDHTGNFSDQFTDQFAPPGYFADINLRLKDETNHPVYPWLTEQVLSAGENAVEGQEITLVLNAPAGGNVQFAFNHLEEIIGIGQTVLLVDQVTGKSWNLSTQEASGQRSFGLDIQQNTTTFALLIGSEEFVTNTAESYLPKRFVLEENYPNPFANVTQIGYSLPESAQVTLDIYDVLGRRITTLVNQHQGAGYYNIEWQANGTLSNGIYFYRISAGGFVQTNKMILVR